MGFSRKKNLSWDDFHCSSYDSSGVHVSYICEGMALLERLILITSEQS